MSGGFDWPDLFAVVVLLFVAAVPVGLWLRRRHQGPPEGRAPAPVDPSDGEPPAPPADVEFRRPDADHERARSVRRSVDALARAILDTAMDLDIASRDVRSAFVVSLIGGEHEGGSNPWDGRGVREAIRAARLLDERLGRLIAQLDDLAGVAAMSESATALRLAVQRYVDHFEASSATALTDSTPPTVGRMRSVFEAGRGDEEDLEVAARTCLWLLPGRLASTTADGRGHDDPS